MQAEGLSNRLCTEFGTISVRDTVPVPITNIDRGRCDAETSQGE